MNPEIFLVVVAVTAVALGSTITYVILARHTKKIIDNTTEVTKMHHTITRAEVIKTRGILEKQIQDFEDEIEIGVEKDKL